MTNTWSILCLSKFSRQLNDVFKKSLSITNRISLINIYYVLSPGEVLSTPVSTVYQKLVKKMQDIVVPDTALLYPLPRKQFLAELWITSGKLLVVLESSLFIEDVPHSVDFQKDLTIVTEYIASGGRVLLILNTTEVNNFPSSSLAHYALLSNESPNLFENNYSYWKWMYKDSILTGGYHRLERNNDKEVEVQKDQPLIAILSIDCLKIEATRLENAFNLLGIPCVPCVDLEDNTHDKLLSNSLSSVHLSDSKTLYCFTPDSEKKKIVNFLITEFSTKCKKEISYCSTLSDLPLGFNWIDYFSNLHTEHLGKLIVWSNSMESSWDFCQQFFERIHPNSGLLVCSNIQSKGKGRGENKWISPAGQAAFTFHLTLSTSNSQMFMNCVTCVQHIVALSVVLACRQLIAEHLEIISGDTNFCDINEEFLVDLQYHGPKILIKWPNDIYVVENINWCNNQDVSSTLLQQNIIGKLAGVLVHCRLVDSNHVELLIGCGINAFNELPTICLEHVLIKSHPCNKRPTFSIANNQKVQLYVNPTLSENNPGVIDQQHSTDTNTYRIVGLDNYGYLLVEDICTGIRHKLHPDGNSMDMMRGLIITK
uniref:Biotin--protein ligase n=1 Tax=Schistosoma haematobium TaxID=6185 RepID=A0A095ATQ4_SCHHA